MSYGATKRLMAAKVGDINHHHRHRCFKYQEKPHWSVSPSQSYRLSQKECIPMENKERANRSGKRKKIPWQAMNAIQSNYANALHQSIWFGKNGKHDRHCPWSVTIFFTVSSQLFDWSFRPQPRKHGTLTIFKFSSHAATSSADLYVVPSTPWKERKQGTVR